MKKIKKEKNKKQKLKRRTLIRELYDTLIGEKNPATKIFGKKLFKLKHKMGWNIYEPGKELGAHLKRFHIINYWLKNKVLIPVVLVFERIFDKHFTKEIPDYWYNKNIIIFDKAYEDAMKEWSDVYIRGISKDAKMTKKEANEYYLHSRTCRIMRTMKKMVVTMVIMDTAFREFLNVFAHKWAQAMLEAYKDRKEVNHVLYTDKNVYNVNYLVIGKVLSQHDINLRAQIKDSLKKKGKADDTKNR